MSSKSKFSSSVIVINGDVLSKVNYSQLLNFHSESKSFATVCIRDHKLSVPFGVVEVKNNEIIKIQEKPDFNFYVNAGIYVLNPSLVDFIEPNKHTAMPDVIERARKAGHVVTIYPLHENWYDLGNEAEYLKHK